MTSDEGGPRVKNQERFAANPAGPIRMSVSELFGVGLTAVGKYIEEHMDGGGILRSASLSEPVKKKGPRDVALRSKMPDGGTSYESIVCRISEAHREDRVNTSRNLPRYLSVDESGPNIPGVSVRVFRGKIRRMGLFSQRHRR